MNARVQKRLTDARNKALSKYGHEYVNLGGEHYQLDVVPTPSLMLDYKLGIGGFPYGHAVEVYGANKIGKSSAIGYGVLANVQKQGKLPALLAIEPRMVTPLDKKWALSLGFNPDEAFIQYPDTAEQAFAMLRDLVFNNDVDYIMIDSLGGLGTDAGAQDKGKKMAYGISGVVTAGLNDIMPRLYKNNIGLMIINQQRQGASFNGQTLYDSPGGEALKHHMRIRIHLKPGATRYSAKIDGENVMVGRELTAVIRKNNLAQGSEKTAKFDFFHIATEQYGFGLDKTQDVINVGKITGVIQGGAWLAHHTFPSGKLNGKAKVADFLTSNPNAYDVIRNEVMTVMVANEIEAAKRKEKTVDAEVSAEVEAA